MSNKFKKRQCIDNWSVTTTVGVPCWPSIWVADTETKSCHLCCCRDALHVLKWFPLVRAAYPSQIFPLALRCLAVVHAHCWWSCAMEKQEVHELQSRGELGEGVERWNGLRSRIRKIILALENIRDISSNTKIDICIKTTIPVKNQTESNLVFSKTQKMCFLVFWIFQKNGSSFQWS